MSEPTFGFDLSRLRIYWRVERPLAELSPSAAIAVASTRLRKSRARIAICPGEAAIKFGLSWRSGRSWLACVSHGTVEASSKGELVVVTVGASLIPLVFLGAATTLVVGVAELGVAWMIGATLVVLLGNYLFVHLGLFLVADEVAGAAPASRAA
jgi:hypothetical protein